MWSSALGALGDDHLDHSHRSAAIRILFVYSCRTGTPPSASCSASKRPVCDRLADAPSSASTRSP